VPVNLASKLLRRNWEGAFTMNDGNKNRDIWGALEETIFGCDQLPLLVMNSEGYVIYVNEKINQMLDKDVFTRDRLPVHYSDICIESFDHLEKIIGNKDPGIIGRLHISKQFFCCVYFPIGRGDEERVIIGMYFKENAPETKDHFSRIIEHKGVSIEQILECFYDGVYISDDNSKTLLANTAFEHMIGIKKKEFLDKDVRELVNKGYFDTSVSEEVRKRKKRVTISQKYKTGKEVLATGNPIFDSKGNVAMVVTNIRDMTDLIEITKRLENNWISSMMGLLRSIIWFMSFLVIIFNNYDLKLLKS
jgi:PAS domain S-box-containing protein